MKNYKFILPFFCTCFVAAMALAETTQSGSSGSAQEIQNNNILRDNATTSQKGAATTLRFRDNASNKTRVGDLTDQEKQLSENFIDHAGANKIYQERCSGDNQQICAGQAGNHKIMGMDAGIAKAIASAYAMFGAMGDILPISKKPDAKASGDKATSAAKTNEAGKGAGEAGKEAKAEKAEDYCKYIPVATEAIATFSQKNTVSNLNAGGETSQKEQLLKAAKSHDGRAEQAQIQAAGWFGGAACYVASATLGPFAADKNLYIKTGAALFLGAVYQEEVGKNKEYAKKTRDVANALPSKGDCNPITENECYCSTPEYANDPNHCKAQIAKRANATFIKVACTNDKLQIDPACACEKNNSCFDKVLEQHAGAELQLGLGYSSSPFRPIAALARGRLEGGTFGTASFAATAAIAKKGLNDLATKIPGSDAPLTPGQKAIADVLIAKGLPSHTARLMAQNPPPQRSIDEAMSKTAGIGAGPIQMAAYGSGRNNVVDFGGGNGLGVKGNVRAERKNGMEDFMGKLGAKGTNVSNAKVLEFAQKAEQRASQISTHADTPIFDIISYRYQTSGRRLLQVESQDSK